MLVVAFGFVVRPRPALAPVMGTGLPRPVPVRASRLRLSAGSELCELPAYPMSIYIEDTDAFAVTCASPPFELVSHRSADPMSYRFADRLMPRPPAACCQTMRTTFGSSNVRHTTG